LEILSPLLSYEIIPYFQWQWPAFFLGSNFYKGFGVQGEGENASNSPHFKGKKG
jgi:hypothetical protein